MRPAQPGGLWDPGVPLSSSLKGNPVYSQTQEVSPSGLMDAVARLSVHPGEACANTNLRWLATQAPTKQCLYRTLINTDSTLMNKSRESPVLFLPSG